jgi:phage tail-like protein
MNRSDARLLNNLPAIYRAADSSGELRRLLGAFEELLFAGVTEGTLGIEQQISNVPSLFAPLGIGGLEKGASARTPNGFLPWLAGWVAFSPYELFSPEQLRRIVAGIVPLYGRRGTRAYLEALLRLCFDELLAVEINDQVTAGFIIGRARIGEDSLLVADRPFWFRVDVELRRPEGPANEQSESKSALERRVRAVIDFASPAHTSYEIRFHEGGRRAMV